MILSRRIALDGVELDQIDEAVVIQSIDPGTPTENVSAADRMGGWGQRITEEHQQVLEARVSYGINIPKRQLAQRRQVFDAVNAWALQKGWLTINWMEGRRMWVEKAVLPGSGDLWDWTATFTIAFRAYGVPFWQDSTATEATIAAEDEGEGTITVPGLTETVCDARITNVSGSTIDTMTVAIGMSIFSFTGLGLADGEVLEITHDETGILIIRIYTGEMVRTALDKRTGGSDDLYVRPGSNAIAITGGNVEATVSCFGRYV